MEDHLFILQYRIRQKLTIPYTMHAVGVRFTVAGIGTVIVMIYPQ